MADITLKRHDTRPVIVRNLKQTIDGVQSAINLSTASAVRLLIKTQNLTGSPNGGVCSITDPTNGQVSYSPVSADTATSGGYYGEYEIAWADGGIETVPNDGYMTIVVVEDLG